MKYRLSLFRIFAFFAAFIFRASVLYSDSISPTGQVSFTLKVQAGLQAAYNAANNTGAMVWKIQDDGGNVWKSGNLSCNVNASASGSWNLAGFTPFKNYVLQVGLLPGCTGNVNFQLSSSQPANVLINGVSGGTGVQATNGRTTLDPNGMTYYTYRFQVALPAYFKPDLEPSYLAAGTCTSISPDKPVWFVGLGNMRDGTPAGVVGFRQPTIDSTVFTMADVYHASYYPVIDHEVDLIYQGVNLHQVYCREVLVDIKTLSTTSYEIDVYSRVGNSVQQPGGAGTTCTFTGSPFVTYVISKTAAGALDIVRNEDGASWETTLGYSGTTWTLNDWHRVGASLSSAITTTYSGATSATVTATGPSSGLGATVAGYTDAPFAWTKSYAYDAAGEYVLTETSFGASTTTPLKTDYAYYAASNSSTGAYANSQQYILNSDGTWNAFTYYVGSGPSDTTIADGQIQTVYRPWLDNRLGTAAAAAAASPSQSLDEYDSYQYTYVQKGIGSALGALESVWLPSSKITCAPGGTILSKTTWTYTPYIAQVNGYYTWSKVENDYYDTSNSLSTTYVYYVPTPQTGGFADYFDNKPVSVSYPTGAKDSYAYFTGSWNPSTQTFTGAVGGEDRLVLCFHGRSAGGQSPVAVSNWTSGTLTWTVDNLNMEPNRSTVTETIIDTNGRTVFKGENVFVAANNISRLSGIQSLFDGHGRLQAAVDIMRSVSGNLYETQYNYTGPQLNYTIATDGVKTSYQYDDLLRNTSTIIGYGGPTLYPAQTLSTVYDAANRPVSAMSSASSTTIMYYDAAGRIIKKATPSPTSGAFLYTNYSYDSLSSMTVTLPTGGTQISTLYCDGRLKSVSGTAQVPHYYGYSANSTGVLSTVTNTTSTDQSQGWVTAQDDLLGRTVSQTAPTTGWASSSSNVLTTTTSYGSNGLPSMT
ncbi:MAG TPA: hypothetical protein VIM69_12025, partial [Opitutaceae bacterium]